MLDIPVVSPEEQLEHIYPTYLYNCTMADLIIVYLVAVVKRYSMITIWIELYISVLFGPYIFHM